MVERMAAYGIDKKACARIVGLVDREFEFFYGRAYERGLPAAIVQVGDALLRNAIDRGDVQAQKFFLATRGGFREQKDVNVSGEVTHRLAPEQRSSLVDAILSRVNQTPESVGARPKS